MTPAPSRRWFRFSLRTLFVVVTACLILADYIRCAANAKLAASGAFLGDMIFAGLLIVLASGVWVVAKYAAGRRTRIE
jgi:hypothetical protein